MWIDTTSEIWKEHKEHFYQGDVFRIYDIQEEIYTLKQGDFSISFYYTKLKKLWQELDNFRPIPVVSCTDDCKAVSKMREYRDSDQVIRFLKCLNEQYSTVRSQIMLMEPLPNIGKVYSLLALQERQVVPPLDESKLLAAAQYTPTYGRGDRGGRTSYGRGKGTRVCSFYNRNNHTVDTCWKKHGYPPHLQHQNSLVNNCVNTHVDDSQFVAYEEENHDSDNGKLVFTPEQHKALIALLQGSSSSSPYSVNHLTTRPSGTCIICTLPNIPKIESFILDSGATDHVCF